MVNSRNGGLDDRGEVVLENQSGGPHVVGWNRRPLLPEDSLVFCSVLFPLRIPLSTRPGYERDADGLWVL